MTRISHRWRSRRAAPHRALGRVPGIERLEDRTLLSADLTAREQFILDRINRARIDPAAEAARLGIDLNQGLAAGTITTARKQPLAPNQVLTDIARAHSQEMLDYDYFDHNDRQGRSPAQRAVAAGYPSSYVGENIAYNGSTGAIDQDQTASALHDQLFRSPGHRANLLTSTYKEAGIGLRFGVYTYYGVNYNVGMVTENFGAAGQGPFLTGVVYADSNGNQKYDIGEGLPGVTVAAGGAATTTGPGGGWALQKPDGRYYVTASGGSFAGTGQAWADVSGTNVEVDFTSGFSGGYVDFRRVDFVPVVRNLGTVQAVALADQDPSKAPLWYSVRTARQALLSVEVSGPAAGGASLALYDSAGRQVAVSTLVAGKPRIDYAALAGQTFTVQLRGTAGGLELRVANLVSQGDKVTVFGTAGDDAMEFDASDNRRVTVFRLNYRFPDVATFVLAGGAGTDTAVLTGAAGTETVSLSPGSASFRVTSAGTLLFSVAVSATERITVNSRGGQGAAAFLGQTATDAVDKFYGRTGLAQMAGTGYTNYARGFRSVNAYGTPGSGDAAYLYDSPDDDTFIGRSTWASLSSLGQRRYYVRDFRYVYAYATAADAGADKAWFYGSDAADTFIARAADPATGAAARAWLYGPSTSYLVLASAFDKVTVYAGGASNRAQLYDSAGDDSLWASARETTLAYPALAGPNGTYRGWVVDLWDFASVAADSSRGGRDTKHAPYDYVHTTGAWLDV